VFTVLYLDLYSSLHVLFAVLLVLILPLVGE